MALKYTIKDSQDQRVLNFIFDGQAYREGLFWTVDLLIKHHTQSSGRFVSVDDETQKWLNQHRGAFEQDRDRVSENFKVWRDFMFSTLQGPLHEDAQTNLKWIEKVLNKKQPLEKPLPKEQCATEIPYRIESNEGVKTLHVNLNHDKVKSLNPCLLQHALILWKDGLNRRHQLEHKTQAAPYRVSHDILVLSFNEKTKKHEPLKSWEGEEYALWSAWNRKAVEVIETPVQMYNELLRLEQARENQKILQENHESTRKMEAVRASSKDLKTKPQASQLEGMGAHKKVNSSPFIESLTAFQKRMAAEVGSETLNNKKVVQDVHQKIKFKR